MEFVKAEVRHGFKRAKLDNPVLQDRSYPVLPDGKHCKAECRKWLDCPLEEGFKTALQKDLEEAYDEIDLEGSEFEDEWLDDDETVFGDVLLKNPYDELPAQEISTSLPYATYVKAYMVSSPREAIEED